MREGLCHESEVFVMPGEIYLNFANPVNQTVLAFLHIDNPEEAATYTPKEVNWLNLSTHPDLVEHFWKLAADLQTSCACVVNKTSYPLLVHPTTGIIFGLAGGTSTMAFRLPESERAEAFAVPGYGAEYKYPRSTVYAKDIGKDWALVKPYASNNVELCKAAFTYAATLK